MKTTKTNYLTNPQSHWTPKQRKALFAALKRVDKLVYCNTDRYGMPCNGGTGKVEPARPGLIQKMDSASICDHGFHGTELPHIWKGELVWIVALGPDAETDGDSSRKWCSKRREFIGLVRPVEAVICAGAHVKGGGKSAKRANLSEADLSWADLSRADLSEANLSRADLSWANLSRANLSWADLSWANLSRANLSRANLSWADLSWADLSEANLSRANLSRAYIGPDASPITVARLLEYGWIIDENGRAKRK